MLQCAIQRAAIPRKGERIPKVALSSPRARQPDLVKPESLVTCISTAAVKARGLVHTARHTTRKWPTPEAGGLTLVEGAVEGGARDWG